MLQDIFAIDRRLRVGYKKLLNFLDGERGLIDLVDNYLADYAAYNCLTVDEIIKSYEGFILRYSEDTKNFMVTQKYPVECDKNIIFKRTDYDIALLLSVVTSVQRYRILEHVRKAVMDIDGEIVIVGVGSGLELELLSVYHNTTDIISFDLNVSKYVKSKFQDMMIFEEEFVGDESKYNNIFAIELLEHIENPYIFLKKCYFSLCDKGKLFVTTATNIPQCDHLYNFTDECDFKDKVRGIGFEIKYSDEIPHESMEINLNSRNNWYVLQKIN